MKKYFLCGIALLIVMCLTLPSNAKHIEKLSKKLMQGHEVSALKEHANLLNNKVDSDIYASGALKDFEKLARQTIVEQIINTVTYKSYYLFSVTKTNQDKLISVGILNFVYVF